MDQQLRDAVLDDPQTPAKDKRVEPFLAPAVCVT